MFIDSSNYKLSAAKAYKNPIFQDKEFERDLSLIKRVAGKVEKWGRTGEIPSRLVYNNFIIACNCFGIEFVTKGLYLLSDPANHDLIMTFLFTVHGDNKEIKVNKNLIINFDYNQINCNLSRRLSEDLEE